MEAFGARPLNLQTPRIMPGDIVVRAENNYIVPRLPEYYFNVTVLDMIEHPLPRTIAVMSFRPMAAGFYSSVFGALPFVLGHSENDVYRVIRLESPKMTPGPG